MGELDVLLSSNPYMGNLAMSKKSLQEMQSMIQKIDTHCLAGMRDLPSRIEQEHGEGSHGGVLRG